MKLIHFSILTALVTSCSPQPEESNMKAPEAKKIAEEISIHGDTRVDDYFWMRLSDEQKEAKNPDAQTQDVLDYLNAENDYLNAKMAHTNVFQKELFDEIVGRIKQDDSSVPYKKNGYVYYSRFEAGEDYGLNCRKKESMDGKEEIILNGPELGKDQSYFALGGLSVSTNNKMMAYSVDLVSRRQYTIHFKDLETGKVLSDKIENTTGGITWANDNKTVFYTKKDPVTLRSCQIYKHTLGTSQDSDELVYEEKDETFNAWISKSKSGDFIFMGSWSTLSSETQYLDANNPNGEWKLVQAREKDHEYSVSHFGEYFYIVTNDGAKNFKLMKTPISATDKSNWEEVIAHRADVLLEDIDIFKNHLVVSERENGLNQLRVMKWADGSEHYIQFNDPAYMAYSTTNLEFDTDELRTIILH